MHRNHTKIITMYKILVIKKKLSLLSKPRLSFHHDSQLSPTTIASIMAIEHHPLTYMLGTWGLGGGPSVLFAPGMLIAVECWWRQYHKVDVRPTGRQCPLSWVGEDFLACQTFFFKKTAVTRKRKVKGAKLTVLLQSFSKFWAFFEEKKNNGFLAHLSLFCKT